MNRRDLLKISGTLFAGSILTQGFAATTALDSITDLELSGSTDNPLLLHYNENSLGLSPKAKNAIIDSLSNVNRYPDSYIEELQNTVASEFKMTPKQITLGIGSSDVIRATINTLGYQATQKKQNIQLITPDPSFFLAASHAEGMNISVIKVPLDDVYCMDITKMKEIADRFDGVSICYLCNPNNPTGTLTSSTTIADWVKGADPQKNFFMVDEAYAEYITDPNFISGTSFIREGRDNVIVLRTFSKIFAMAGMRLGYGLSTEKFAKELLPFMAILNISTPTAVAGTESIKDKSFIQQSRGMNSNSLAMTTQVFDALEIKYLPSQGNFLFHQIKCDQKTYMDGMKSEGIIIGRPFPPFMDWSRVTLGTPEEMNHFLAVIKKFKKNGWV
ncbi:aminotransferase class I/II-fold pyridoxal phosphate-dependent enzyme [Myroides sp. M-43]|uniref:pyridoxal phosphate-dependent aminotransferase n=1 Tax=Myroides oncorhynchi TaxID=2893756 RepID=UPI001E2A5A32|nr:aminotransferase class I/II-fold pyridoxal phosphate-dependent enzyme [Myroides oncorhynchi]MCC9041977.1 aminotransferase class I/II-fold pyridoxal phosphate-dependent enzyme [Myroides oncorhynchi]